MSATNHRLVFDQKAKVARLQWDIVVTSGFHPVPGGEVILTSPKDCDACAALQFLSEDQLIDLQWFWIDVLGGTLSPKEVPVGKTMTTNVLGVCCSCQSVHSVHANPDPDPDSPQNVDEASLYYMASHRTGGDSGPWCDGHGTVPQALVKK